MESTYHILLSVLSGSLSFIPKQVNWSELYRLSTEQGVAALTIDVLHRFLKEHPEVEPFAEETPKEKAERLQWLGSVVTYEKNYARHEARMARLARLLAEGGYRMMVLKGWGLSRDWPVPEHRPVGDLDIYNFGKQQEADAYISKRCCIKADDGHEHHTVYAFSGIIVENHYDFINVHAHRDSPTIEARLKTLAHEKYKVVEVQGTKIYLPSSNFNAIFLMRHMAQHFAGERITLRHILDWGYYMQCHSSEVDWKSTLVFLNEIGLMTFFHQINAICVDYLGFSESTFPTIKRNTDLEERILADILHPEFAEEKPKAGLPYILVFKCRRWWHNRWKHTLVYKEPLLSIFLTLAWSHLKHIKTIKDQ